MRYRVEVEEERTGRLVYQDTRVSEYRGGDVDYSNTTSSLLDHGYYTALVFLHTGGQNISSFPLRLPLFQEDKIDLYSTPVSIISHPHHEIKDEPGRNSGTGDSTDVYSQTLAVSPPSLVLMLTIIGVLAAVLLCLLMVVVVIGVVYLRNRFSTSISKFTNQSKKLIAKL